MLKPFLFVSSSNKNKKYKYLFKSLNVISQQSNKNIL